MVDRQDIDALLVGALYGELTPAEEARLAAHLESHPTDRSALEDLKHARAAVRESRIFDQQDEPPQAISALLLQEAHRRAPKAARMRSDEEREGWFARITRSFFAHPAMAAAAMLVLVLGVAGTVYMKKGANDQFANTTAPQVAQEMTAGPTGGAEAEKNGAPGAAAGSGYAVALAGDQTATRDEGQQGAVAAAAPADDKAPATGSLAKSDSAKDSISSDGVVATDRRQATAHSAGPAPKKKYAELRTEDPQPMDLDSPTTTKSRAKGGPVNGLADLEGDNARGASAGGGGAAGGTGNATGFGTTVGRAQSPQPQAQPQAPSAAEAPAPPPPPVAKSASVATPKPTPSSAPPAAQAPAQNKLEAQPQTDALLGWAQGQLAQAISLARKDQCSDAAKIAMTIHDRAPAFYSQNVADNRELKGCAQYLRAHAEQAEEKAKRAAPAKANNADNAK